MDEHQKIHSDENMSEQTNDVSSSEQDFRLRREKKVESFVLDLDEHTIAPDPEPNTIFDSGDEKDISSFSEEKVRPHREHALARRKKHGCMYRVMYFCVIIALAVIISQFAVSGVYDLLGASREEGEITIVIEPDMTDEEVIEQLAEKGAIKESFFYTLYAKITKASYSPGTYVIAGNADYELIINSLRGTANRIDTVKITFIEGETLRQFAKKLEDGKVCTAEDFLTAINEEDFTNFNFVEAIPDAADRAYALEGYLFPDTYEFYQYENPKTAIRRFLNNMLSAKLTREIYDKAEAIGMTIDEVLTLASIIQKESGNVEDMYKISSVFHNRLNNWGENGLLQSDVTFFYEETLPDEYDGLYDTYVCAGLPIGPICNPGMQAIKAALNPSNTNYYYFVADVNGKTYYARTLAEHEKNIAYAETVKPESGGTSSVVEGD